MNESLEIVKLINTLGDLAAKVAEGLADQGYQIAVLQERVRTLETKDLK